MKRIILLTLLLLPFAAYSAPMSESACRKVAAQFMASRNRNFDAGALQLANERMLTKSGADCNEYYIYKTPGKGFVIVAGDDSVVPVIGYSVDGTFRDDESMTNFRHWMGIWSKTIRANRARGLKATPEIRAEWDRYTREGGIRKEAGDECLLETALWGQGNPYNIYCPKIGNKRALTGCVATAMGILMRYFEWPVAGTGMTPAYTSGTVNVPAVKLGEPYDWKNMPLSPLSSSSADDGKHAVATLLYHAGVMVKAKYGLDEEGGTAAYSEDIRDALVTYMDYDKSAAFKYAEMYSREEWVEMLKNNIKNVGPVIYGGAKTDSGHEFVVAGYDAADRFYINWGWEGGNNGYYSYPGFDEFTEYNDALFNLKIDCGGKSPASIDLYHHSSSSKPGISLSCVNIGTNAPFTATVEGMWNTGTEAFRGDVGIARVNSRNEVLEVLSSLSMADLKERGGALAPNYIVLPVVFKDCVIKTEPAIGDKLMCVFRDIDDSNWSICHYDRTDGEMVGEIPLSDPFSIEQATRMVYSTEGTIRITSKSGVALKLVGPGGEDMSSVVSSDAYGWTIDAKKLSPAKYRLQLSKDKEFKEITISMGLKK